MEATALLDGLGLRHAIVGGLAVGAWGVNRSTDDVDIFVEMPLARREEVRRGLVAKGYRVPAMKGELEKFGVFRSRSKRGVFLDLFDATGPLGAAVLDRSRVVRFGKGRLRFAGPEELALLKAFSERPRDFDDLAALLAVRRGKMDLAYLREWAERLDRSIGSEEVTERIESALAVVGRRR